MGQRPPAASEKETERTSAGGGATATTWMFGRGERGGPPGPSDRGGPPAARASAGGAGASVGSAGGAGACADSEDCAGGGGASAAGGRSWAWTCGEGSDEGGAAAVAVEPGAPPVPGAVLGACPPSLTGASGGAGGFTLRGMHLSATTAAITVKPAPSRNARRKPSVRARIGAR